MREEGNEGENREWREGERVREGRVDRRKREDGKGERGRKGEKGRGLDRNVISMYATIGKIWLESSPSEKH